MQDMALHKIDSNVRDAQQVVNRKGCNCINNELIGQLGEL